MRSLGFSLIELTVVIVVLGILAAVFIPRSNTDAIVLGTQAEQFAADIRYVQSLSMSRGQRYRFSYTASGYGIYDASNVTVTHPGGSASIAFTRGVSISPFPATGLPNNVVAFDGKGWPFSGISPYYSMVTSATINLLGASGTTRGVTIYPETGMVRLQ